MQRQSKKPLKVVACKVDVVAPKVDFCIEFTMERKFDHSKHMLSWVHDLAFKDNEYKDYVHDESEEMTTLKCGCRFKVKSYVLSSGQWSLNVVNGEHNHHMTQDSTYKTNKYRLPLLEFVGSICTGKTYAVAFAFLTSKKEDNFVWVTERPQFIAISRGSEGVRILRRKRIREFAFYLVNLSIAE
ncbi:FAR1-related protein [Trifolium pratense]|uniref:FAR1-related protein n=1 Tax=Trifolium pratense TaxID=57577 RepID=A0A2K3P1E5_TRIPR|nr:FAR1-related protein [Trifolium pratense]